MGRTQPITGAAAGWDIRNPPVAWRPHFQAFTRRSRKQRPKRPPCTWVRGGGNHDGMAAARVSLFRK